MTISISRLLGAKRTKPPLVDTSLVSARTSPTCTVSPLLTTGSAPVGKLYTSPERIHSNPPRWAMRVVLPWRSVFSSGTNWENSTSPAKSLVTSFVAFSVDFWTLSEVISASNCSSLTVAPSVTNSSDPGVKE